jgi:hypothetical protein
MLYDTDLRSHRRRLIRLALLIVVLALVTGTIITMFCWSRYRSGVAVTWSETQSQLVTSTVGTAAHLVDHPLPAASIVAGILLNLFALLRTSRWLAALLGDALIAGGWIMAVISLTLERFG